MIRKRLAIALAGMLVTATALVACSTGQGASAPKQLLVWVDSARTPGVQQYMKDHPNVPIRLVTIPSTVGYLTGKISLDNRSQSGWPDVVFLNTPEDIATLTAPPFNYAAPLNDLVSQQVRDQFSPGALAACTFGGSLYCLRDDIGQTVLWYNKTLMTRFGYQVPTTWAQYQQEGEQLAAQHPGYVIGQINGKFGADVYFESSGCPTRDVVNANTVRIDTAAPECTRVARLLQPLVRDHTVLALAPTDPAFVQLGNQDKVLMMPGASWYGDYLFKPTYKTPAGQLAAAPMPTWDGTTATAGAVGGGMFAISRHANKTLQSEAADLITWLTTNVAHQAGQPTYPAFAPAAVAWCQKKATDTFYAADPCPVLRQEAALMSPTLGMVRYQSERLTTFNSTIVAAAQSGGSLTAALSAWGTDLIQAAKADNYTVVSSQ